MATVFAVLYFFLPGYIANMSPIVAKGLRLPLDIPVAAHLLGAHKTYRGILAAIIGAMLMLALQRALQDGGFFEGYRLLDYRAHSLWFLAFLFGGGAMGGDMFKSFWKRRMGIPPGSPWPFFDQIDFVVGGLLAVGFVHVLPWQQILILILITPFLHVLTNVIGWLIGWKEVWS